MHKITYAIFKNIANSWHFKVNGNLIKLIHGSFVEFAH